MKHGINNLTAHMIRAKLVYRVCRYEFLSVKFCELFRDESILTLSYTRVVICSEILRTRSGELTGNSEVKVLIKF